MFTKYWIQRLSRLFSEPVKGSVAFWMGSKSDNFIENESVHGGCPVLEGSKWILNKWIYAFNQWKKFPCNLTEKVSIPGYEGVTH